MQRVDGRYDGKIAVVTGGASGIGEAIVRRLIAEQATVIAGDLNKERLDTLDGELGERFVGVHTDVRKEVDVAALVNTAVERFGALHAGFNVAGVGRMNPIMDLDQENWQSVIDITLTGVVLSMKHEAQAISAAGGGAILNISSLNSEVPAYGAASYCAAKAGVVMATKCGALELAEHGIRVNAISPGLTATPATDTTKDLPGLRDAYLERIPMRRVGSAADIAAAALYLCSDDASYISGVNLFVDGAWATSTYPDLKPFVGDFATARAAREALLFPQRGAIS
jgi:NAD(P)-dependent dehydrogenase (short-subunit alcohol dehydrogenase family)